MLEVSYRLETANQFFNVLAGRGNTKIKRGAKIMVNPYAMAVDSGYVHQPFPRLLREALNAGGYKAMFDEFFSWFGYVNATASNLSFAAPGRESYDPNNIYTPIGLTGDFEICERSS